MRTALPRTNYSGRRLALAFAVAAMADGLSFFLTLTPPIQWVADLITAIVLFAVLGWQWILLPGLVMEAIPGLYVFPFWLLMIGAVAVGRRRASSKSVNDSRTMEMEHARQ